MSTFDKQKFGQRFREMRIKAGYARQIDLAEKLGTVVQTISNYESGNRLPDAEMLSRIVEVLPCNADYLLGFEDKPTYSESFITEQIGLSSEAITSLKGIVNFLKDAHETDNSVAYMLSKFILSGQFFEILMSVHFAIRFQLKKKLEDLSNLSDKFLLDDLEAFFLEDFENGEMRHGLKYDIYTSAARHKAIDAFSEFFDSFILDKVESTSQKEEEKKHGKH